MTACCESMYCGVRSGRAKLLPECCSSKKYGRERRSPHQKWGVGNLCGCSSIVSTVTCKARICATGACVSEQQRAVCGSWEVELVPEWPKAEGAVPTPNIFSLGVTSPAVLLQSEGEMHFQSVVPAPTKAQDGVLPAAHCAVPVCVCGGSWGELELTGCLRQVWCVRGLQSSESECWHVPGRQVALPMVIL